MANKFQIDITARDRTAEGLRGVNDNFAKLAKGTPLEKVSKSFAGIQEKAGALKGIARSLFSMGDSAAIASGGIGEAAGGIGALGAAAGVATLGVVAVGAGLGIAAAAAYKFEEAFTKAGAATGYTAQILGMSTDQLQAFQIAGRKVGVSAEAMTAALQSMGNTMNDAVNGRNQTALALMNKLGIKVHHLKDGSIDAARGMMDLSAAMVNGNAQTKQMIVAQFGVGAAEAFMLQSTRDRTQALKDAAASGAIMSAQQIKDSQRFQKSVADMDDHWHGLLNTLSQKLIIPWLQPMVDDLDRAASAMDRLINGKGRLWVDKAGNVRVTDDAAPPAASPGAAAPASGRWRDADGVYHWGTPGAGGGAPKARGRPGPVSKAFKDVMQYFIDTGWTQEQAAGIAANIQHESGFDIHSRNKRSGMYGLANWDTKRRANFARWSGHDITDSKMEEQLAFINYELRFGSERRAGHRLRLATSGAEAARVVNDDYERNGVAGQDDARAALAQNALNGKVHVDVHIKGAPAGTVAVASAQGAGVTTAAKISPTMAGAA